MKRKRTAWLVAVAAGSLVVLTACSPGGSSTPAASDSAGGSAAGGPTTAQLAKMQTLANEYTAVPKFVAPGPAFDVSSLKGKKIMVMPTASQLVACEAIAKNIAKLAETVGMTAKVFDNSGGAQGWIPGVQQATSQKYDALVLVCGIDPNLIKPQIEAAEAAGVSVIDSGLGDADLHTPNEIVTASTNIGQSRPHTAAAALAFLAAKGAPIDFLEVTSNDIPSSVSMSKAFHSFVSENCSACKIKSINVAVPDWGNKIQPAVASALLADPKITVIMATFDGMLNPIDAAIKTSGNKNVHIYGLTGGTPEYIAEMGTGSKAMTNVGSSTSWRAYAAADLTFRVLAKTTIPSPDAEADGMRIFTPDNYKESADPDGGYGDVYPKGYESLWQKK
jgi:ribose transport system substrate-binding protein